MKFFVQGIRLLVIALLLSGCGLHFTPYTLLSEPWAKQKVSSTGREEVHVNKVLYEIPSLPREMIQMTPTSNIQINPNGFITTGPSDGVPHIYQGAKKWGMFETKVLQSPQEFQDAVIEVGKVAASPKDEVMIEVSVSEDGSIWTEYTQFGKDANEIAFLHPEKYIKYRFTLLSYSDRPLVITKIALQFKNPH